MNKGEAERFIIQGLESNHTQGDIVAALCQELNAPEDLVSKFVAQVAKKHQPEPSPSKPAYHQYQNTAPVDGDTDLSVVVSKPAIDQILEIQSPADPPVKPAPHHETWVSGVSGEVEEAELEKMVFQALRKDQRHSDIVLDICEQTGMSWDRAQRLVSRVATHNRKHLVARQNLIIIPLASIALLAGLALIVASLSEGLRIAQQMAGSPSEAAARATEIEFILQEGLWGFVIGISLLLGGVYGLIRALQTQFE